MRSMRFWGSILAAGLALSSCASSYDCRSKPVHDRLFSILRDNFFDVLGKTHEPGLQSLAALAGFVGLVAGVAGAMRMDREAPELHRAGAIWNRQELTSRSPWGSPPARRDSASRSQPPRLWCTN